MNNLAKKRLLIITIGIVGLITLITLILLIYNAIFGKTTYQDIENKVIKAAKKYYSENEALLPKSENEVVTVTDSTLTSANHLKSMIELTKDLKGVTCNATVIIRYVGNEYRYTPILDCGSSYSTKTLASYIKENEKVVYTGEGLYELNGELVYRGENLNNYVNFSNKIWRIVKIEDGQVMLILSDKYQKAVWDDRFNVDRNRSDGINDYRVSRIHEYLSDAYQDEKLLNKYSRTLLMKHPLYIGKRYETDIYNDGSIEKQQYLEDQYIGLLPLYDYINASIDNNCTSASTTSCTNYNYLNHVDNSWWTLTADASNTYKVYKISNDGSIESSRSSSNAQIRPVVYLAADVLYVDGTGTIDNPYIIK